MVKQFIYKDEQLPSHIKWQIISFFRVEWSNGFSGKNQSRDWISSPNDHPIYFVLMENDLLVGFVGVVWKNLEHNGIQYKTYGLSGVFTYPPFRKQGYGLQLVKSAKEYIEKQDGDIVLFTSIQKGFYEKAGFIRIDTAKLLEGDPENPKIHEEDVFMLLLLDKGKGGRNDFETKPIYFGRDIW
jgi:predicted acetyltransferase